MFPRCGAFVTVTLSLVLVSCGGGGGSSASECRAAATAQAMAEDAYVAAITAHDEAHTMGHDDHPDTDDQTFTRRVDLIVAVEATGHAGDGPHTVNWHGHPCREHSRDR